MPDRFGRRFMEFPLFFASRIYTYKQLHVEAIVVDAFSTKKAIDHTLNMCNNTTN